MKSSIFTILLILVFLACQEDKNKNKDNSRENIENIKNTSSDSGLNFIQKNFVGIYEAQLHHGVRRLYIEKDYVLLKDYDIYQNFNYAYIGTLDQNIDTLELKMKFCFDRLAFVKGSGTSYPRSDDYIEFSTPNDTMVELSKKQFRFLPVITDSDTLLVEYYYNQEGFKYRKIK